MAFGDPDEIRTVSPTQMPVEKELADEDLETPVSPKRSAIQESISKDPFFVASPFVQDYPKHEFDPEREPRAFTRGDSMGGLPWITSGRDQKPPVIIDDPYDPPIPPRDLPSDPSFLEVWGAAAELYNWFYATNARNMREGESRWFNPRHSRFISEPDPDYNFWKDDKEAPNYDDWGYRFNDVKNPREASIIKRRIDRELYNLAIVHQADFGWAAIAATSMMDPLIFVPFSHVAKASRLSFLAGKMSRLSSLAGKVGGSSSKAAMFRRIAKTGIISAGYEAGSQSLLHAARETHTVKEGGINTAAAFLFGSLLGGAIEMISPSVRWWHGRRLGSSLTVPGQSNFDPLVDGLQLRTVIPSRTLNRKTGIWEPSTRSEDFRGGFPSELHRTYKPDAPTAPSARSTDLVVRTPEFKKEFGGSTVVNNDGSPKIVLHGTSTGFKNFMPSNKGLQGAGIYFTDNPSQAQQYSNIAVNLGKGGKTPVVKEAYLSITNPYRFDYSEANDVWKKFGASSASELTEKLKDAGYDGTIMTGAGGSVNYTVFDNNQILTLPASVPTADTPVTDVPTTPRPDVIKVYTGSDEPFTQFDVSKLGTRTDPGFAGRGAYTTTDLEQATRWGQHVMESEIPSDAKLLRISNASELYDKHGLKAMTPEERELPQSEMKPIYEKNINDFTDRMIEEGYDGVEWTMSDGTVQYVLFKPDKYTFSPIRQPTADAPSGKFDVESALDEFDEVDPATSEAAYKLAKDSNLGITSDRELSGVVKDDDGKVIGAQWKSFDGDNYEFDIVVDPAHQGTGIGTRLINDAIEGFKDFTEFNPNVTMKVHVTSPIMEEALERRGFVAIETLPGGGKIMERPAPEGAPVQEMSLEQAVNTIRQKVRGGDLDGWFRNADKNYKARLVLAIEEDPEVRNAALKIFHDQYQAGTGITIPFQEFLDKPITLYRGGRVDADEPFSSFSYNKKMAQQHADRKSATITEITVRPRETLGMMQTIAEGEVLVPTELATPAAPDAPTPRAPEVVPEDLNALENQLKREHGDSLEVLNLREGKDYIKLIGIRVAEGERSKGVGSAVINALKDYAYKVGKPIILIPEAKKGKKTALGKFYKAHEFKKPGRKKDFGLPVHSLIYTPPPRIIDLSYKELQKRAKAAGIKANQKKNVLVAELTAAQAPAAQDPSAKVVTPEQQDADYMAAALAGDTETAQRLVDEAANKSGYTVGPVYHGSTIEGLTKFDLQKTVEVEGAFFFSSEEDVAYPYTFERAYSEPIGDEPLGDVITSYLSFKNPLEYIPGSVHGVSKPNQKIVDAVEMGLAIKMAKSKGHDSLIIRNIDDTIGGTGELSDIYAAFSPTQIKSADPITHDADGKVIPLSQRFDISSSSIKGDPPLDKGAIVVRDKDGGALVLSSEFPHKRSDLDQRLKTINFLVDSIENWDKLISDSSLSEPDYIHFLHHLVTEYGLPREITKSVSHMALWQRIIERAATPEDILFIKKNWLSQVSLKLFGHLSPKIRLAIHPLHPVRVLNQQLQTPALILDAPGRGVPTQHTIQTWSKLGEHMAYTRIREANDIFKKYLKEGGELKESEFFPLVSGAMIRGDVSDIPRVQEVAKLFRSFINEVTKEAQQVKILPKELDLSGAQSYLMRYFDIDKLIDPVSRKLLVESVTQGIIAKKHEKAAALGNIIDEGPDSDPLAILEGDALYEAAKKRAENYVNNQLKLSRGAIDTSPLGKAGSLHERTLDIDDTYLEEWLVQDPRIRLTRFARSVIPDVKMFSQFGTVNARDQIEEVKQALDKWVLEAPTRNETDRRRKNAITTIRDLEHVIEEIRNRDTAPNDVTARSEGLSRRIRQVNYNLTGGAILLSSIVDPAYIVQRYGITNTWGFAFVKLFENSHTMKLMKQEALLAGEAIEGLSGSQLKSITDLREMGLSHNTLDNVLTWGVDKMQKWSLVNAWNGKVREWSAMISQHHIITASQKWASGTIGKRDKRLLLEININEAMARRIAKEFNRVGVTGNIIKVANSTKWKDEIAVQALIHGIHYSGTQTIMRPGVGDRSVWMTKPLGRVISQYLSFGMTATSRLLISGLQRADLAAMNGWLMASGLALIGYISRQYARDPLGASEKLSKLTPAQWAMQIIDRNGYMGILLDYDEMLGHITRGAVSVSAWTDHTRAMIIERGSALAAAVGVTGGTLENIQGIMPKGIGNIGKIDKSQISAFRRLVPFRSLFYLQALFMMVEKGLIGDDEETKRRRSAAW